jgi:hypothetical protein
VEMLKLILAGGLLGWSIAANAVAQDGAAQESRSSLAMRPVTFTYGDYIAYAPQDDAVQTDKAAPPAPGQPGEAKSGEAKAGDDDNAKEEEKPTCRWCTKGKLADPWTLFHGDALKEHNIVINGWIESGIYANQWGTPSNGPVGLRSIGDGYTVDQVWLSVDRKTDTKGCGWDLGGHIDYLWGVDGPQTQAFGDHSWDWNWNTSPQYGSAIPQLYAEIAYNDLKVKAGRFYTPIGYEVVQAPQNFFYSHSYSHTFGEPFTHTGALAAYAPNEKATYYGGWTNGWDEGFEGRDHGSTFLGGVSINLSEKATLAWYVSAGYLGDGTAFPGAASGNLYYNCIIYTRKLTDKLTYVFEHDLGTNYDVVGGPAGDNQWYQINNYLTYKLNDCWSVGGRAEWFQDPQGARVNPGSRGDYYAFTAGFNYKPHANFTLRPELRYDSFEAFQGTTSMPFNNGTSSHQLSGGFDAIFTF